MIATAEELTQLLFSVHNSMIGWCATSTLLLFFFSIFIVIGHSQKRVSLKRHVQPKIEDTRHFVLPITANYIKVVTTFKFNYLFAEKSYSLILYIAFEIGNFLLFLDDLFVRFYIFT